MKNNIPEVHHHHSPRLQGFARDGETMVDGIRLDVWPCHGVPPPANMFGKPIVGPVSAIIDQNIASVQGWCKKNGNEDFHRKSYFYHQTIRNEGYYNKIVNYMGNNPKQCEDDKFYLN